MENINSLKNAISDLLLDKPLIYKINGRRYLYPKLFERRAVVSIYADEIEKHTRKPSWQYLLLFNNYHI